MHQSLIDAEGFPLPDIDHYHIRRIRMNIIGVFCLLYVKTAFLYSLELSNDHKAIMDKIELLLPTQLAVPSGPFFPYFSLFTE
jgi:Nas2 N_terminal domain